MPDRDAATLRERAEAYIAREALNVTGENEQAATIMEGLLAEIDRLRKALRPVKPMEGDAV